MATHGSLNEFDSSKEDWVSYTERLQQYFIANSIPEDAGEKRRALLLSACGPSTYQLIRSLVSPAQPKEKTFEELVEVVKKHHNPKPSVIVERYNFNTRIRKQGETVAAYVAQLRRMTEHCEFGTTLEDMLRDRLVCGIQHKRIQRRLLMESKLTFQKAVELAQSIESAEKDTEELQPSATGQEDPAVHGLKKHAQRQNPPSRQPSRPLWSGRGCYRCGKEWNAHSETPNAVTARSSVRNLSCTFHISANNGEPIAGNPWSQCLYRRYFSHRENTSRIWVTFCRGWRLLGCGSSCPNVRSCCRKWNIWGIVSSRRGWRQTRRKCVP